MKRPPRVFFSFRSPYSWLAVDQVQRTVSHLHERVKFIPYWEPDELTSAGLQQRGAAIHYVPMSKAKHLYILQDTKRLAERYGFPMAWPVDRQPWWEPSHLGWLKARRLGRGREFYDAIVRARWREGANISEPCVIERVAFSIGLDGTAVARAHEDNDIRAEGVDCLADAYEDDIFGVPYFRIGWQRFWGFDRISAFVCALDGPGIAASLGDVPAEASAAIGAFDVDSPGGCG